MPVPPATWQHLSYPTKNPGEQQAFGQNPRAFLHFLRRLLLCAQTAQYGGKSWYFYVTYVLARLWEAAD